MAKAALLAALVALGLAGFTTWKTSCSKCGTTCAPEAASAGDVARLEAIERRLAAIEDAPEPAAPGPTLGTAVGAGTTSPPAASGSAGIEMSPVERLDELEKRMASVEEARKKDAESATSLGALGARAARFAPKGAGWLTTTEDAQKELELTDGQKAEWDRIVADAKREGDAIRRIPDDEGKTWDQAQKEMVADLMGSSTAGGAKSFDFTKIMAFRNKTIPGRSETYGQADQRIKDDAKRRMRDTLTTAQTDKFDKSVVDPMLGGPGAVTTTFALPVK